MKTFLSLLVLAVALLPVSESRAQSFGAPPGWNYFGPGWGGWMAWGGGYGFGEWHQYQSISPLMGKVEIRADVDYDAKIDFGDKQLGKEAKFNPYGLMVGSGELTKLLLTAQPNGDRNVTVGEPRVTMPFHILVASLEVRGVNLGDKRGRFKSFEQEVATCGRLLVWLDHNRKYLLLDSADPARRKVEWPFSSSVPPERVFVEGVMPTHPGGAFVVTLELDDSKRTWLSKFFYSEPAIWDRQLITVHPKGVTPKPWKDNTPVWASRAVAVP
jgi:hypothetical protein